MRANMTAYCEDNELHLARIFHDWKVAPNRVDYPGLGHAINHTVEPGTHALLLGDSDFVREPSPVLATLAEALLQTLPDLYVCCFIHEQALERRQRP